MIYTIVGNNRGKEVSYFIIALHQNVFVSMFHHPIKGTN